MDQAGPLGCTVGHEYVGVVEEVGVEVPTIRPDQFVVGSFIASDNTCATCRAGSQSSCVHRQPGAPDGAQAERMRVPLAEGTLVATSDTPPAYLAILAARRSPTGWGRTRSSRQSARRSR